jgi:hypothetical protein
VVRVPDDDIDADSRVEHELYAVLLVTVPMSWSVGRWPSVGLPDRSVRRWLVVVNMSAAEAGGHD